MKVSVKIMCEIISRLLKAQAMIGSPYEIYFKELVRENCTVLRFISVTCTDITNTNTIFGLDLSGMRGETVRHIPARVET